MSAGLADLHSHVLPGVDDGPEGLRASLALARLLVEDGVTTVAATPHVHPEYPQARRRRLQADAALREEIERAGLPLEVILGAELDIDEILAMDDDELAGFGFGGGQVVLVEFPWVGRWPEALPDAVDRVRSLDLCPIIAHPERIDVWSHDIELIADLRERGAAIQLTSGSLLGHFGRREEALSTLLLDEDLVDLVASDSHGAHRPPCMSAAREAIAQGFGPDLAAALVVDGPRQLLDRGSVPARPRR